MPNSVAALRAALSFSFCAALSACGQFPSEAVYPSADFRPPALVDAGPTGPQRLVLSFDEDVSAVEGSLALEPRAEVSEKAEKGKLLVDFSSPQSPGADYSLAGEVSDKSGNRTRFLLRFSGWNDRAPQLRLSEAQTGKNGSKTRPHRDYVELEALGDGNIGGEELSWASSLKSASYRFPGAEVKKGDFIVLHLAPEGKADERDETSADRCASGGIDATPSGRDFWCKDLPLSDACGAIAVSLRPGDEASDALFYADEEKSGALPEGKLADFVAKIADDNAWPIAGNKPEWEDAFRWKGSSSKSIYRAESGQGPAAWLASASGAQSPGAANGDMSKAPDSAKKKASKAKKK
jgi:hypothetical protein